MAANTIAPESRFRLYGESKFEPELISVYSLRW
jgi:hypothetical protein